MGSMGSMDGATMEGAANLNCGLRYCKLTGFLKVALYNLDIISGYVSANLVSSISTWWNFFRYKRFLDLSIFIVVLIMRVYRVRAFTETIGFGAITAEIARSLGESPPMEEVEFMSIPVAVLEEVEPATKGKIVETSGSVECQVEGKSEPEHIVQDEEMEETMDAEVEDAEVEMEHVNDDERDSPEDYTYLEDLGVGFTGLDDLTKDSEFLAELSTEDTVLPNAIVAREADSTDVVTESNLSTNPGSSDVVTVFSESNLSTNPAGLGRGFRVAPDDALVKAGQGIEKQKSHKNDRWASRRADQLRASLGWDMSVDLGDLDFNAMDELLSDLFTRVVKVNGKDYPSDSLVNLCNGYNRIMRRGSDVRCVTWRTKRYDPLGKDFRIQSHFAFPRTRLVLRAAVRKTAKEGNNKKRFKVGTVTLEMEMALMLDLEHQMTDPAGCQKRLILYLVLRLGVRGGLELRSLMRDDIKLLTDCKGREFIAFEERESKNNITDIDRIKEEQFRKTYYSFEEDFVLTWKQYSRHLPPMEEGVKPDLFMQPIQRPVGYIWYNKVTKVSERVCSQFLKNMMTVIGLPPDLATSNKAGRVTLVTRMAASGVPDEIGMMVTGHHTTDGYGRYDRTKDLKMEAAILVTSNPSMSYNQALSDVSVKFVQESIVGTPEGLRPLLNKETAEKEVELRRNLENQLKASMGHLVNTEASSSSMTNMKLKQPLQEETRLPGQMFQVREPTEAVVSPVLSQKLATWHEEFNQVDWVAEIEKNPSLARAMAKVSRAKQMADWHRDLDNIDWDQEARRNPAVARHLGPPRPAAPAFAGNTFSNLSNCTIQICVGPSGKDRSDKNKENERTVNASKAIGS